MKRKHENIQKIIEIQNGMDFGRVNFTILTSTRQFIREYDFEIKQNDATFYSERHCYLFSDMILLSKKARLSKFKYELDRMIILDTYISIVDSPEGKSFEIKDGNSKPPTILKFNCDSAKEKIAWIKQIEETINEFAMKESSFHQNSASEMTSKKINSNNQTLIPVQPIHETLHIKLEDSINKYTVVSNKNFELEFKVSKLQSELRTRTIAKDQILREVESIRNIKETLIKERDNATASFSVVF